MALEIKNVKKIFPMKTGDLEVLSDINLSIENGEIVSIVGVSGCGKSTLLKILAGLDDATSGDIVLDENIRGKELRKKIGMIFQESRLFPWCTVEHNIAFGLPKAKDNQDKRDMVQEYIDLVGLKGFEKAYPNQLSGGMQQRVSIARTLIHHPSILLLDEPFGALDALTKINMQKEVIRIWQQEKTTMIIITHDIDEAIYLGNRVVVMSEKPGVIKKIIPIKLARPRDRNSNDFASYRRKVYEEFFEREEVQPEYTI
ncbi:MAG: ABC transporter ATP-binding protein [Ruminiclostridium sp.]